MGDIFLDHLPKENSIFWSLRHFTAAICQAMRVLFPCIITTEISLSDSSTIFFIEIEAETAISDWRISWRSAHFRILLSYLWGSCIAIPPVFLIFLGFSQFRLLLSYLWGCRLCRFISSFSNSFRNGQRWIRLPAKERDSKWYLIKWGSGEHSSEIGLQT